MKNLSDRVQAGKNRIKPFIDFNAWVLIIIGIAIFSLRVQFTPGGWVNLPLAFTVLQTGGLIFAVCGIQMMASKAFWPDLKFRALNDEAMAGNIAAGLVLLGLLFFNGVALVASVMWLTSALGAGITS